MKPQRRGNDLYGGTMRTSTGARWVVVLGLGALGAVGACAGKRLETVGDLVDGGGGEALGASGAGSVVPEPKCNNGVKDAREADIDCGGPACDPCVAGASCARSSDCESKVCLANLCQPPSCTDEETNGDETDVDCGGGCSPCELGQGCGQSSDCRTSVCVGGACRAAGCEDGQRNGDETDVDCGGSCAGCGSGQNCESAADCSSKLCASSACASCHDGRKNGNETDVDCGGSDCEPCGVGAECNIESDCVSEICRSLNHTPSNQCLPAHCNNLAVDGDEIDLNCGGSCELCVEGRSCNEDADCESGHCGDATCFVPCSGTSKCGGEGVCESDRCTYCHSSDECDPEGCGSPGKCACSAGYFVCNPP